MKKSKRTTLFLLSMLLLISLSITFFLWKSDRKTPLLRTKVWSIGIYTGDSPLHLFQPACLINPVLTAQHVTDVPAGYVADPFMILADNIWYMFFEVFNNHTGHGDIALAVSQDGYHWEYRQIVLDKPYHLSYPFVFQWRGSFYMIPESYQSQSVQLFLADEFPIRWSCVGLIMEGNFVDSTLVHSDNKFWLFAESNPEGNDRLSLFYAEALTGPWMAHPRCPVVKNDGNAARPAGRIIRSGEHFLRYAQDDLPEYGNRIRAFEIRYLTLDAYEEQEVIMNPLLKGDGKGWNADGMHHIDCHQLDDGTWIACVDGYRFVPIDK